MVMDFHYGYVFGLLLGRRDGIFIRLGIRQIPPHAATRLQDHKVARLGAARTCERCTDLMELEYPSTEGRKLKKQTQPINAKELAFCATRQGWSCIRFSIGASVHEWVPSHTCQFECLFLSIPGQQERSCPGVGIKTNHNTNHHQVKSVDTAAASLFSGSPLLLFTYIWKGNQFIFFSYLHNIVRFVLFIIHTYLLYSFTLYIPTFITCLDFTLRKKKVSGN